MNQNIIFYQLFELESSTYTYLLADPATKEAVIIDSVLETAERDLKLIQELGLELKYILDTHIHADHVTGAGRLRALTGAKSAISHRAKVECVDHPLKDGDMLFIGKTSISAFETPGHTNSCMSFLIEGRVFTGDALLIRGTGRTDFQGGSSETLFDSVHQKLFTLPDHTEVYPGHDYKGQTKSTISLERQFNPRLALGKTKSDFVKIMAELKLASPKKIAQALPANLTCGIVPEKQDL